MTDCTKGHETQCRQAKGLPSDCECRCGGKNHGIDRDGPRFEQTTTPLRGEPVRVTRPSIPCDRHPLREATTTSPDGTPLCDHCADQLGLEKGER